MWKFAIAVVCLAYCVSAEHKKAVAVLNNPAKGITGKVTFEETDDGVLVHAEISGLTPGSHGFHVHEKGDVSAADCTSAGPHFNPFNKTHGYRTDKRRHVGDLGNVEADPEGKVNESIIDRNISFTGDTNIIGRAIVIHADMDDGGRSNNPLSQTTGNSGARLACGLIEVNSSNSIFQYQTSVFLSGFLFLVILTTKQCWT